MDKATEATPLLLAASTIKIDDEIEAVPVFSKNLRPVQLDVRHLNYSIRPSLDADWDSLKLAMRCRRPSARQLLHDVNISVRPGQLLAILGSSGSGKTTLLDLLACRHEAGTLDGSITLNGRERTLDLVKEYGGYVMQEDRLFPSLTVRETLTFVARLKMPARFSLEEKTERVEQVIAELGLIHVADSPIGGSMLRGISGGERRRVSIGAQLLLDPSILFLDEPTSGLDSFTANNVVETLQSLARSNRTIVTTIHSPRSDIVKLFDLILILSQGRTVYFGPGDQVVAHFEGAGYPCPRYTNPADFCLDLTTVDFRSEAQEVDTRQVVSSLVKHYADNPSALIQTTYSSAAQTDESFGAAPPSALIDRVGAFEQFRILVKRQLVNRLKSRKALAVDFLQALSMGMIVGAVFYDLSSSQVGVQDRFGLFYITGTLFTFLVILNAVTRLHLEKPSLYVERVDGLYDLAPYYFAKTLGDLPFDILCSFIFSVPVYFLAGLDTAPAKIVRFNALVLLVNYSARSLSLGIGSAIKRYQDAAFICNFLFTLFLLPCGFIINLDTIYVGLRWIADISLIQFAFSSLSVNEFTGATFNCPSLPGNGTFCPITTGEEALQAFALEDTSIPLTALYLGCLIVFFQTLFFLSLKFIDQRPK